MESAKPCYEFDDVRVDVAAHRLEKGGLAREVEPKAFDVLRELLEHPGELCDRDHLLDVVWGHRHVTPGVLNRAVAQLRRALGDDAAEPRYIETVHGLGYRFTGTLVMAAGVVADAVEPGKGDVPRRRSADHGRHRWWGWLALSLLLGAAALVRYGWLPSGGSIVAPPFETGHSLVVLPFTAHGGAAELLAEAEGLSESLTDAFARRAGLRVAGRQSAAALARQHASPQKAVELLDVDLVLAGELRAGSEGVVLRTRLWRRGDPAPLWTDEAKAPRAQLFRVVAPLIERVAAYLPPSSRAAHADEAVSVQDLYWLGRRYWYQRTPDSLARSLTYFRTAVEQAPDFALGYSGIADACMLLYEYADMRLDDAVVCASGAIARAKALAPDLADAHASEGLMLLDEGDIDAAVMALEHALQLDPRLPNARLWYGDTLAYAGRVREAREVHAAALTEDPLNAILQTYLGVDALLAGDEVAATRHLQRASALDGKYVEPIWQIALQHQLHGRMAEAGSAFAQARATAADSGWTALYESYTWLLLGDAAGAARTLAAAGELASIDRYEALSWQRWLSDRVGDLRTEIAAQQLRSPSIAGARRYDALLARVGLLGGDDAAARATYDKLFAARVERGDPFFRPWIADVGLGHFAAWIALLPDGDATRTLALDAYRHQLKRYRDGGVAIPVLTYQEALLAALRADSGDAQRLLEQACAEGWLDATALRRDPGWRRYRDSAWLADAQRRIDARVTATVKALAAGARAAPSG